MLRSILGALGAMVQRPHHFEVKVILTPDGKTTVQLSGGPAVEKMRTNYGCATFKMPKGVHDVRFHQCEHDAQIIVENVDIAVRVIDKVKVKKNKTLRARLALNEVQGEPVIDVLVPNGALVKVTTVRIEEQIVGARSGIDDIDFFAQLFGAQRSAQQGTNGQANAATNGHTGNGQANGAPKKTATKDRGPRRNPIKS